MSLAFRFEVFGLKQAEYRSRAMGAAAVNMVPVWIRILEYFNTVEQRTFESQGRRGGGSWKQDSVEWLTRKAREGLDPRINIATGTLMAAMTQDDAPGRIVEMTPSTLRFGTDLPQAEPSQRERPFLKLTEGDRLQIREAIKNHLAGAFKRHPDV